MKLGLDMEQTVGSPGEEKREKERERRELLWFSTRGLRCTSNASQKVDKGSLRSASTSYLCCCKLLVSYPLT